MAKKKEKEGEKKEKIEGKKEGKVCKLLMAKNPAWFIAAPSSAKRE
jgi:hypothetical protein